MLNPPESIKCSVCSRMKTAITDPESGEVICSCCGMVISEYNGVRSQQRKAKTRPGLELLSLCHHTILALRQLLGDQVKMLLERNWTLILIQYSRDYELGILEYN